MRLEIWRQISGLSRESVARRVGASNAKVVWRWEMGEQIPRRVHMLKIYLLTIGQVTPNDFYDLPPLPPAADAIESEDERRAA